MSFGGNSYNGGRTRMGQRVLLNVYDLTPANDMLYSIGFGFHHSGVEINGTEYSYAGGAGIFEQTPKVVPNAKYRETIDMGTYEGTTSDIKMILSSLRNDPHNFHGNGYNLIKRNCNHFSNALCYALLKKTIPGYVNRMADFGVCFSCLLPKKLLQDSPVHAPGSSGGGGSSSSSGFQVTPARSTGGNSVAPSSSSITRPAFGGTGSTLSGNDGGGRGGGGMLQSSSDMLGKVGKILPFASSAATTTTTTSSSAGGSSSKGKDDLTDRREKARKAALARLEGGGGGGTTTTTTTETSTNSTMQSPTTNLSLSSGSDTRNGIKQH